MLGSLDKQTGKDLLVYSLTPNCGLARRKNWFKAFFFYSSSEERFHKNDVALFCGSPFVCVVMLACFIVKNRLVLFPAAVLPAEPEEWELGCALRPPSMALFPKCLSAAVCLPACQML